MAKKVTKNEGIMISGGKLTAGEIAVGRNANASSNTVKYEKEIEVKDNIQSHNFRLGQSIFISYRRKDSADVTGRIYDTLIKVFGREKVYIDVHANPLGLDFRKHTVSILNNCKVVIAIIGSRWLSEKESNGTRRIDNETDSVRMEIEYGLKRDLPIIPILVQNASIPKEDELPFSLKALSFRNGISVRSDAGFHIDMEQLIKGIETHLETE
jgi:hypothetical protein